MKLTVLLGAPVLDVSRGRRTGVAERFFAREGYLGVCGLMVKPKGWFETPAFIREGGFRLMPDSVCALESGSSPSVSNCGDWYPLPLGAPVLFPDGERADQALDYELGPLGELISVLGESAVYPAERILCVGPDAVVTLRLPEEKGCGTEEPPEESQEETKAKARTGPADDIREEASEEEPKAPPSLPAEPPPEAGRELLGRVAMRDIYDIRGEMLLRKGRTVAAEHIRQAYEQGLLVALATGTTRNEPK